jgi:REP element-mobilizing transposase RayT
VWVRGNDRRDVFLEEADRHLYLSILGLVVKDHGWRCLAYCQMTNHVHLVIETPRANLAQGMCQLNGRYARAFNQRHGHINHVFGARYGVTPIGEPEHLWYATAYVVLNPGRAGLVDRPEQWPWSSHAATAGLKPPPRWLDVARLLSFFEVLGGEARRRYVDLIAAVDAMGAVGLDHTRRAAA